MADDTVRKRLNVCVTGADGWYGFNVCYGILTGNNRHLVTQLICGVCHTDNRFVSWLEDQGATIFRYSLGCTSEFAEVLTETDAVVLCPPIITDDNDHVQREWAKNLGTSKPTTENTKDRDKSGQSEEAPLVAMWAAFLMAIECARIRRVVMMSVVNLDQVGFNPELPMPRLTELRMLELMFQHGFLRHAPKHRWVVRQTLALEHLYLYQRSIQRDQKLLLPIEQALFNPVTMMDVGDALVVLLMGKHRWGGKSLGDGVDLDMDSDSDTDDDVSVTGEVSKAGKLAMKKRVKMCCFTGRNVVSGAAIACYASEALGTTVRYHPVSSEESMEMLKQYPDITRPEMELLLEQYQMIKFGFMSLLTRDLERKLTRKPRGVSEFFGQNREDFKPEEL
ncbi:hypothetical protein IWQ62_002419 [Dispira parvispora]|uniref:Uncharacterized protein n=1 Tax=Dispira parvispora TaxID=1520584 RepID=A0A9W8AQF4_9FUNG|nr:hypothetical protein IWQ62_002419 [Dispira parvispora]